MRRDPRNWQSLALGDLCEVSVDKEIPASSPNVPFIGMEHVESHTGRVLAMADSLRYKSAAPKVTSGQVLYGRLRPYLNKVFTADRELFVSGEFIPLQVDTRLDPDFLKYRLLAQDFVSFAVSLNAGDRPRVKWPQIAGFRLDLPPLDEQRRIVDVLEDHLSRVDAAIYSVGTCVKKSEALLGALLDQVFRMDGDAFGQVPLRSLLERQGDGRWFHQGWSPRCDADPVQVPEDWGVLKTTAIHPGRFDASENKRLPLGVMPRVGAETRNGDFLITRKGPRARCGVATYVKAVRPGLMFPDTVYRFRVNEAEIEPEYLSWFLRSSGAVSQIDRLKTGISESGLNLTHERLLGVQVPKPTKDRQRTAIARLDYLSAAMSVATASQSAVLARSLPLRHSLLAAAFSGKLLKEACLV